MRKGRRFAVTSVEGIFKALAIVALAYVTLRLLAPLLSNRNPGLVKWAVGSRCNSAIAAVVILFVYLLYTWLLPFVVSLIIDLPILALGVAFLLGCAYWLDMRYNRGRVSAKVMRRRQRK